MILERSDAVEVSTPKHPLSRCFDGFFYEHLTLGLPSYSITTLWTPTKIEDIDNIFWWAECLNEVVAANKEGQPIGERLEAVVPMGCQPVRFLGVILGRKSKR